MEFTIEDIDYKIEELNYVKDVMIHGHQSYITEGFLGSVKSRLGSMLKAVMSILKSIATKIGLMKATEAPPEIKGFFANLSNKTRQFFSSYQKALASTTMVASIVTMAIGIRQMMKEKEFHQAKGTVLALAYAKEVGRLVHDGIKVVEGEVVARSGPNTSSTNVRPTSAGHIVDGEVVAKQAPPSKQIPGATAAVKIVGEFMHFAKAAEGLVSSGKPAGDPKMAKQWAQDSTGWKRDAQQTARAKANGSFKGKKEYYPSGTTDDEIADDKIADYKRRSANAERKAETFKRGYSNIDER